jgi:hypothetical protein
MLFEGIPQPFELDSTRFIKKMKKNRVMTPVDTSIAETGSQEASGRVSQGSHLAEVRLRHVGGRRQRVYK